VRPPSQHLSGKDLYSSLYHAIHQPHHKKVKPPHVHIVHPKKPPVVHVKKPHVVHPPKPHAPKKPHVVHPPKPHAPKKPHVVHPPKPHVVHAKKPHIVHPPKVHVTPVKKVHLAKPPKAAKAHGVRITQSKRPLDQTPGAAPGERLNADGTKGRGHISRHDGPNPYHWHNHPAATTIVNGHRGAAPPVAGQGTAAGTLRVSHRSSHATHTPATHTAKPHAPHAPRPAHVPKAPKAPKPPLQLNTDSFLGSDSHVESHNPTPLVPVAVHRSSGFSLSHHR